MGSWDWLLGSEPEKYEADPNASRIGSRRRDYDIDASRMYAAGLDTGGYGDVYRRQTGLANLLDSTAQGNGPSAAGVAGQKARDSTFRQAGALQAGRRGRNSAAGALTANNAIAMGQQESQATETQGRINEANQARGQLTGLLGQQAGQEVGIGTTRAGLQQQANQANAQMQQEANIRNQAASLGISTEEMRARMQQEQMKFGNLKPGGGGLLPGLLGAGGAIAGGIAGGPAGAQAGMLAGNAMGTGIQQASYAQGGYIDHPTLALIGEAGPEMVVPLSAGHEEMRDTARTVLDGLDGLGKRSKGRIPAMANGGIVDGPALPAPMQPGTPYGYNPPVQLMGIGQRVVPNWNANANQANAALQALTNAIVTRSIEGDAKRKAQTKDGEAKSKREARERKANDEYLSDMIRSVRQHTPPVLELEGSASGSTAGIPAMANGGIVAGPGRRHGRGYR